MYERMNACMDEYMHDSLDSQSGDCMQMYHFRNTGPRIMPPQQSSRGTDGTGDPNGDMLNPDGSIRSGKKRKSHDNVATSYVALPLNAPTGLVASSRCEALCSAVKTPCVTCYSPLPPLHHACFLHVLQGLLLYIQTT